MFFFTFIFDTLAFTTTNIVKRASAELFYKPNFVLFVVSFFFFFIIRQAITICWI